MNLSGMRDTGSLPSISVARKVRLILMLTSDAVTPAALAKVAMGGN